MYVSVCMYVCRYRRIPQLRPPLFAHRPPCTFGWSSCIDIFCLPYKPLPLLWLSIVDIRAKTIKTAATASTLAICHIMLVLIKSLFLSFAHQTARESAEITHPHNIRQSVMVVTCKYRIAGKFGGELNLAVWWSARATAKLKSANVSYSHIIYVWRSRTELPN